MKAMKAIKAIKAIKAMKPMKSMKPMKVMKAKKAMTLNGPLNGGNEGKEFVSSIVNKCICGSHKSLIFLFSSFSSPP